jgi:uncharacterized protein YndB with AHSA1/START domain
MSRTKQDLEVTIEQLIEPITEHVAERGLAQRRLVAEVELEAPIAAVWKAITEGEELIRWFPFQARSEPGPEGWIWMSWDGAYEDRAAILAWEPNQHLRTDWKVSDPKSGENVELIVDYRLEARGGSTLLRLVHHGFSADDDWDDIVDSHRRGWSIELRSLRLYLEHHRGRNRGLVRAQAPIVGEVSDAWQRLWSGFFGRSAPEVGSFQTDTAMRISTTTGDQLAGRVLFFEPPTDLAVKVESLDNALLRVSLEPCSPGQPLSLRLWLFSWTMQDDERDRLQQRWQAAFDRIFAPA